MTYQKSVLLLATVIMLTVAAGILAAVTVRAPRTVTTDPVPYGAAAAQARPTPASV
ncbi:hypothetical protein [Actinomadura sp. 21ATH]|uniref:hypothetical protein n=1 Tax=Actinomadura sp. 21ATH TaxID=1735444 RepID=UPI0035C1EE3C